MEIEDVLKNKVSKDLRLFTIKRKPYHPSVPSGYEGRFNGEGTMALYAADSLEACWREIKWHNPEANINDYSLYEFRFIGKVVDLGVYGTEYVSPRKDGGWDLPRRLTDAPGFKYISAVQYPSSPAVQMGASGTSFSINPDNFKITENEFTETFWK